MNLIFMKNCCKICKSLFEHDAKRTEVCACHDLNISVPLGHKIKHPVQKKDILKQLHESSNEKIVYLCVWLFG